MRILLPPSETKCIGGTGSPLDFEALSFPELTDTRKNIARALSNLDPVAMQEVLGLTPRMGDEIQANLFLFDSPTSPAIERYTGVLYDALDAPSLDLSARRKLVIASALFGLVQASDPIPKYRLSAGTKLPLVSTGEPVTMKKRWGSSITNILDHMADDSGLILDMRSGAYAQLGPSKKTVTVRIEKLQPDGTTKVVSHYSKHYKGILARILTTATVVPKDLDDVADLVEDYGFTVAVNSPTSLTFIVEP